VFSLWLQMEAFALVFIVLVFHFVSFFIFIIFIFATLISPLFICCFSICCNNSLLVCHVHLPMYLKTPHLPPFLPLHIIFCLVLTWTLWLYPLLVHHLHICCNNSFLSYSLFLSFNCDYKISWPPLSFMFILFIFVLYLQKISVLLFYSFHSFLLWELPTFLVYCFCLRLVPTRAPNPSPFLLCLMLTKALLFPIHHIYLSLFIETFCSPFHIHPICLCPVINLIHLHLCCNNSPLSCS